MHDQVPSMVARLAVGLWPKAGLATPAEIIMTRHARTFDFAARWLPEHRRRPVVDLYAFCRTLDDLVDEPDMGHRRDSVLDELAAWRAWLLADGAGPAPREPIGSAMAPLLATRQVPRIYLLELIDGLASDLEQRERASFADLHKYCFQVAGTVGLALAHLLGATSPAALAAAESLGLAMQLTNIIRDVGEDLRRGRLYLPSDELAEVGLSRAGLRALVGSPGAVDERLTSVVARQIERAQDWYRQGLAGVGWLPHDCRLPILIAGRLYRRILTAVVRNEYNVLHQRAATSGREKAQEAVIAAYHVWRLRQSPRLNS